MPLILWYILGGAVLVIVSIILFKAMWRVARPSQALVISGRQRKTAQDEPNSMSFRIVTGGGTFVVPLVEAAEILDLSLFQVSPTVNCPTKQGVLVGVKGVVIFKIGDDDRSIANAARRFLGKQAEMAKQIQEVFAGQLRSIVGGMTVEEMIQDRTRLTQETRDACAREAQALGLVIDSLQIQEIEDPTGYIENIAKPNLARVQMEARIAEAKADQEATAAEETAKIANAGVQRETAMKVAAIQAEVEAAQAKANQQGPLAKATAEQEVVAQEALLAAERLKVTEQELNAKVRLTAEAEAFATITRAEADRKAAVLAAQAEAEATRAKGVADAEAAQAAGKAEAAVIQAKGEAEGAALEAKARGMAEGQEAVLAQLYAEKLPDVVRAAASAFDNVDNMTVLNGAAGLQEAIMAIVVQGTQIWHTLRGGQSGSSLVPTSTGSEDGVRLG